jgi:hypothetical protein
MKKEGKNPTKKPPEIRATQRQTTKKGKSDVRKSLNDYNHYIGSATQASDYETTTEYVINYIKKTFDYGNDIGTELKELTPIDKEKWKVSMKFSMSSDERVRTQESKQFELEF